MAVATLLPSTALRLEGLAEGTDTGRERQAGILALGAEMGEPHSQGTVDLYRREYGASAGAALATLNRRWAEALRRRDAVALLAVLHDSELVLDAIDQAVRRG